MNTPERSPAPARRRAISSAHQPPLEAISVPEQPAAAHIEEAVSPGFESTPPHFTSPADSSPAQRNSAEVKYTPETPATSARPGLPPRQRSHARFPDEPEKLERRFTGRLIRGADDQLDVGEEEKQIGEQAVVEPEPTTVWQRVREYCKDVSADFGAVPERKDPTEFMGDSGIDMRTLRKLQSRNNRHSTSNIISSGLLLSGPGFRLHSRNNSQSTLAGTTAPSSGASTPNVSSPTKYNTSSPNTPGTPWKRFQDGLDPKELTKALKNMKRKIEHGTGSREAKYVAAKTDIAARRTLCLLLTYAFMLYGAPSHRIEEYVLQLFKVCDLDGRINYLVGCTEVCFINPPDQNDPLTRQSYTTLVKAQGLDVGSLEEVFKIYKQVIRQSMNVDEATVALMAVLNGNAYYKPWWIVPFYGFASAAACVWAYNGWWTDMPVALVLGSLVGFLQVIAAARNPLYANVLEVSAALVTSFVARAIASIGGGGDQKYFCFGAIAESSITMILPGYIVLCGALELQAKSLTAGATRLFYAVIYSLFLGYGINVGAQLWGVIDSNAPTSATCPRSVDPKFKILLVPFFIAMQAVVLRSRPRQIPVQILFGSAAYTVNYFVAANATSQVANTASALTLGILGHLYARSRHAFAFASVVAGIMVLVPSGLSAQGGLIAGIETPLFNNGTLAAQTVYEQNLYRSFSVGAQMIQVAVGLSVGLFVSALFVYPLGRKNNALFSF